MKLREKICRAMEEGFGIYDIDNYSKQADDRSKKKIWASEGVPPERPRHDNDVRSLQLKPRNSLTPYQRWKVFYEGEVVGNMGGADTLRRKYEKHKRYSLANSAKEVAEVCLTAGGLFVIDLLASPQLLWDMIRHPELYNENYKRRSLGRRSCNGGIKMKKIREVLEDSLSTDGYPQSEDSFASENPPGNKPTANPWMDEAPPVKFAERYGLRTEIKDDPIYPVLTADDFIAYVPLVAEKKKSGLRGLLSRLLGMDAILKEVGGETFNGAELDAMRREKKHTCPVNGVGYRGTLIISGPRNDPVEELENEQFARDIIKYFAKKGIKKEDIRNHIGGMGSIFPGRSTGKRRSVDAKRHYEGHSIKKGIWDDWEGLTRDLLAMYDPEDF